jgi:selenide,water dikinase
VLSDIPPTADDRVLIDFRTADDAGVYRWEGGPALVQTVDFFTPIVDDPYVYGQIAAANAISDVYAMGGRPVTALAIAAFPKEGLEPSTIRAIFRGGFDTLREAGVALLGGHTVQDREIKFGYAITGAIDPRRILSNAGAKPGDALFLTKPLGTGIVGTAIKFDRAPAALMVQAVESMRTLNRGAADALQTLPDGAVHACTDITGFGLAGHGTEMALASGVTLEIGLGRLPIFDGVAEIAAANRSGGLESNQQHFGPGVLVGGPPDLRAAEAADARERIGVQRGSEGRESVARGSDPRAPLVYDPQTSGGLLVAVDPGAAGLAEQAFERAGVRAWRIGSVVAAIPRIHVHMV